MTFDHATMDTINTIILLAGTLIVPGLVFFVNAQVAKQLASFELRLAEKLERYLADQNARQNESMMRSAALDKRVTVVESWQEGVQTRMDSLVKALDAHGLREEGRHHA